MRNNAVNIEFLKKRTEKLTEDVEKLIRKEIIVHNKAAIIASNRELKELSKKSILKKSNL